MLLRYWYTNCPLCGPEGELCINKKRDTGQLCFQCAECGWACDHPEDCTDFAKGYRLESEERSWDVPTLAEIRAYGWAQYCVHTMPYNPDEAY